MADPEHLEVVQEGRSAIAQWRKSNPNGVLNLREAALVGYDLSEANLGHTNFRGAALARINLTRANLTWCDFRDASLRQGNLTGANMYRAQLKVTDLTECKLCDADLTYAQIDRCNLSRATLIGANLSRTSISNSHIGGTDFGNTLTGGTLFIGLDLACARGLESIRHRGASSIGINTLTRSKGRIPAAFLRGCGVPETLIDYLPHLIASMSPIQFYSCFISYSSKNEAFARRLHSRLEDEQLRVWFAPADMRAGRKSKDQIDDAIWMYDRLLLVLSEESMQSEWVRHEIKRARQKERESRREVLFPISLVSFSKIKEWECCDADSGEDLAEKVREYHIPDFSTWTEEKRFEEAFADLMRDLRREAQQPYSSLL